MSTVRLEILYNGKRVNSQNLPKEQTQIQPRVFFQGEGDKLYTLLMWDPDAPAKSWLHWLITNISGSVPDILQGDEIISYAPPSPPSGIHRYFFTVYEQPSSILVTAPSQRGNFNVDAFVQNQGLKKITERMVRVPA